MSTPLEHTPDAAPLVRATGLTRRYPLARDSFFERQRYATALEDATLEVRAGEALGLIGESGSGKSTLVRLLLALDVPTSGTIEFDGRPVDATARGRSLHWLRRATGMVFQDPYASLDPRMSVGRIIAEPLWALGIDCDRPARVDEVLTQVGLDPDAARRFSHEFSGGQRQRIALARAIVHKPRLLVGDEPLSALDVTVRAQVLDVIAELRASLDLTLILVSHDIGVVQSLCDTVAVMTEGRIVEHGTTNDVLLSPQHPYTRRLLASIPTIDPQDDAPAA